MTHTAISLTVYLTLFAFVIGGLGCVMKAIEDENPLSLAQEAEAVTSFLRSLPRHIRRLGKVRIRRPRTAPKPPARKAGSHRKASASLAVAR